MSHRFTRLGWLRSLATRFGRRPQSKTANRRRIRLEQLESRYVLTAPVAVDDSIFMNVSTPEVPNADGQILALHNDSDPDGIPPPLKIVAINEQYEIGGEDLSVVQHNVTVDLTHGTLTAIFQNGHLEHFNFAPDDNFTGDQTFTYRVGDGGALFSNVANVTIHVRPYTGIGYDITDFVHEGDGVHFSDYRIDEGDNPEDPPVITSRSGGPDLEYYWYIDTTPGADFNNGDYEPPEESLVEFAGGLPVDRSVSVLDLAWEDLAAFGINDGLAEHIILSLKVVDANGFEALDSTFIGIVDVAPSPTEFMLSPVTTGGCGDSTVILSAATFAEPNLAEDTFTVSIDWDLFDADPSPLENLEYTNNGDGTYTVTAVTHNYAPGVDYLPMLYVVGEDADEASPFPSPINGWFLLTPSFDLPAAKIRTPGVPITLESPEEVDTEIEGAGYAWSVTKDGAPYELSVGTVTDQFSFSFTPTEPGAYIANVTVTTVFIIEGFPPFVFDENYGETFVITGGGTASPPSATINGAPATSAEGTAIALTSSIVQSSCGGAAEYDWVVTKNGSSFATSDQVNFNFTPDDNGTYVVTLIVSDGGGSDTENATITVNNVAPTLGTVSAVQPVGGGPVVNLSGSFTDPGLGDTFTVQVVWETGGTPESIAVSGSGGPYTFAASHTYTSTGSKPISVTVSDDDNGSDNDNTGSATVQAALSASGVLAVLGAGGGDDVTISLPVAGTIRVESSVLGSSLDFAATAVTLLQLDLGNGDDTLFVASGVTQTVLAFGGAGNDVMIGGGGSNVLVGGSGLDVLTGRGARDILIGGADSDVLSGGAGQDILVDGETSNDGNAVALAAILAEWTSGDNSFASFQQRVRRLSGLETGGLNGSYIITALDNATLDLLLGGAGNDWILSHNGDISFG